MKKYLAIVLASLMCLSACSKQAEQTDSTTAQKPTETSVTIIELYSEDGKSTDPDGIEYEYSYHVPQIDADTVGAKRINDEISSIYGEMAKSSLERFNNQEIADYLSVTYESYNSGNCLSIVIKTVSYWGAFEEYATYNYDTENGVQLTNDDLISIQGINQEQYLSAVRNAAVKDFDKTVASARGDYPLEFISYTDSEINERRAWTISSNNITCNLPTYIDNDGKMNAVVAVGTLGEADYLYKPLVLKTTPSTETLSAEYSDYLIATYANNEVTVQFKDTATFRQLLSESIIKEEPVFDAPIPIKGCYSDYVAMYLLDESNGMSFPTLYLITSEGLVEYVILSYCLENNYFCAGGPYAITNIASLEIGESTMGTTVFANLENGENEDLWADQVSQANSLSYRFMDTWSTTVTFKTDGGGSYESNYVFEIVDWYDIKLIDYYTPSIEDALVYEGTLSYYGMSEDGLVYEFIMSNDEDEKKGAITIGYEGTYDSNGNYVRKLIVKEITGGFIYSDPGEIIEFFETVG